MHSCFESYPYHHPNLLLRNSFFASRYTNARISIMLLCILPFLIGTIGLWTIDKSAPYGRLVCLWICFTYTAAWSLSMSVATANTAGHTKKITTNAMLIIGYCLGNFIGPFFFKSDQAPGYTLGVGMMFLCVGVQVLCLIALWILLWVRNRARRELLLSMEDRNVQNLVAEKALMDETDLQNEYFQVSLLTKRDYVP